MSKIIWKYNIPVAEKVILEVPKNAKILCVQEQHQQICMWALVDPALEKVERIFHVYGTGNIIPDIKPHQQRTYIGTVQLGEWVYHIFEITY